MAMETCPRKTQPSSICCADARLASSRGCVLWLGFAPWDVRVPEEPLAAVAEGDGEK